MRCAFWLGIGAYWKIQLYATGQVRSGTTFRTGRALRQTFQDGRVPVHEVWAAVSPGVFGQEFYGKLDSENAAAVMQKSLTVKLPDRVDR